MSQPRLVLFADLEGARLSLPRIPEGACIAWVHDPARVAPEDARGLLEELAIPSPPAVLPHRRGVRKGTLRRTLEPLGAELGLVFSYSRILRRDILDLFPNGVANLHGGRLPEYRGANVLQWAILEGEKETAMSLHYMDEGIDTGPVIASLSVPIPDYHTAVEVRDALGEAAKRLLNDWVPELLTGRCPARIQDERRARHWPRRRPEDGEIDWTRSSKQIRNLMRALVPPWPPAYSLTQEGERIEYPVPLSIEEIEELRRRFPKP